MINNLKTILLNMVYLRSTSNANAFQLDMIKISDGYLKIQHLFKAIYKLDPFNAFFAFDSMNSIKQDTSYNSISQIPDASLTLKITKSLQNILSLAVLNEDTIDYEFIGQLLIINRFSNNLLLCPLINANFYIPRDVIEAWDPKYIKAGYQAIHVVEEGFKNTYLFKNTGMTLKNKADILDKYLKFHPCQDRPGLYTKIRSTSCTTSSDPDQFLFNLPNPTSKRGFTLLELLIIIYDQQPSKKALIVSVASNIINQAKANAEQDIHDQCHDQCHLNTTKCMTTKLKDIFYGPLNLAAWLYSDDQFLEIITMMESAKENVLNILQINIGCFDQMKPAEQHIIDRESMQASVAGASSMASGSTLQPQPGTSILFEIAKAISNVNFGINVPFNHTSLLYTLLSKKYYKSAEKILKDGAIFQPSENISEIVNDLYVNNLNDLLDLILKPEITRNCKLSNDILIKIIMMIDGRSQDVTFSTFSIVGKFKTLLKLKIIDLNQLNRVIVDKKPNMPKPCSEIIDIETVEPEIVMSDDDCIMLTNNLPLDQVLSNLYKNLNQDQDNYLVLDRLRILEEMAILLLEQGAISKQFSFLNYAVVTQNLKLVERCLSEFELDVNFRCEHENSATAIILASSYALPELNSVYSSEIIDLLLAYGADVTCNLNCSENSKNSKNSKTKKSKNKKFNQTVLSNIIENNNLTLFSKIKDQLKSEINKKFHWMENMSPLGLALILEHYELAIELLKAGADPNFTWWAVNAKNILKKVGGRYVNSITIEETKSINKEIHCPLLIAIKAKHDNLLNCLLEKNADINKTTSSNQTILQFCIKYGNEGMCRLLIEKMGDNSKCSKSSKNLLRKKFCTCENAVLTVGYETDSSKPACTPIFESIKSGENGILKMLLDYGADPLFVCSKYGTTAMSMAEEFGNEEALRVLEAYGKF